MIRKVRGEEGGAAQGECRCSSPRVRRWWILTINCHDIEISIAGIVEMVRDPNLLLSFFFFSLSFFFSFLIFSYALY